MKTVRITPVTDGDGNVFLDVYQDNDVQRVGPLQAGVEVVAVFDEPKPGASPPSRYMKRLSRKQERRNAELLGGRVQPGSGSSNRAKGDVRKFGEWRGESKFTFAKAFSLKIDVLEKITSECAGNEKPVLFLDYKRKDSGRTSGSYVVLHEADFEDLVKKNAPPDDR